MFETSRYEVSLPVFEGPLDLLMYLVNKNRIDIHDIPIHEITDQYLEYLNQAKEFNLPLASSFFEMAATLLYIKSRMLLPKVRQAEEGESEDPREELARSLEEFKWMKKVKARIQDLMEEERPYRTREPMPLHPGLFHGHIPVEKLNAAFMALYESLQEPEVRTMKAEEVTLDDKLADLRGLISSGRRISLTGYFKRQKTRLELAVSLFALLELIRMGEMTLLDTADGLQIRGIG